MSRRQNMPLPERIRDAPDLLPGLDFYYEAFQRLTTSRQMGMSALGPIPYAAISGYCKDEDITGELREDIIYHTEHLDSVYMEWQRLKLKDKA